MSCLQSDQNMHRLSSSGKTRYQQQHLRRTVLFMIVMLSFSEPSRPKESWRNPSTINHQQQILSSHD